MGEGLGGAGPAGQAAGKGLGLVRLDLAHGRHAPVVVEPQVKGGRGAIAGVAHLGLVSGRGAAHRHGQTVQDQVRLAHGVGGRGVVVQLVGLGDLAVGVHPGPARVAAVGRARADKLARGAGALGQAHLEAIVGALGGGAPRLGGAVVVDLQVESLERPGARVAHLHFVGHQAAHAGRREGGDIEVRHLGPHHVPLAAVVVVLVGLGHAAVGVHPGPRLVGAVGRAGAGEGARGASARGQARGEGVFLALDRDAARGQQAVVVDLQVKRLGGAGTRVARRHLVGHRAAGHADEQGLDVQVLGLGAGGRHEPGSQKDQNKRGDPRVSRAVH